jgi:tRNA (guanine-N7-)-methyltransferase
MPRKKQIKFELIRSMPNVVEIHKLIFGSVKGNWLDFFGNDNPIVLELGCGYGEYTNGLAVLNPNKNYIGVDVKGERIWAGANFAIENKLDNVAFLQTEIYNLPKFFVQNEVDEIWITFPDPQVEKPRKRLTNKIYFEIYKQILKPFGFVHLKTDSDILFDYTLKTMQELNLNSFELTQDLYNSTLQNLHQGIKTGFEKVYLEKGVKIKYLSFKFSL